MDTIKKIKEWNRISNEQDNSLRIMNVDKIVNLSYFELGIYGFQHSIKPNTHLQIRLYPNVIGKELFVKELYNHQHPRLIWKSGSYGMRFLSSEYNVIVNVVFDDDYKKTIEKSLYSTTEDEEFMILEFGNIYIPNHVKKISIWFKIYKSDDSTQTTKCIYISNHGKNYNIDI